MEIGGDQVASKSTRTRTITVIITVLLVAIAGCYFVSQYGFSKKIHRKPNIFERPAVDLSHTDIAIFVVGDSYTTPSPDLRGNFWEPQLASLDKNLSIHYIADRKLAGQNKWQVPTALRRRGSDPGFCERNVESWTLFTVNEKTKRWYFKAQQDTYINLKNLLTLVAQLDKKIDPMKQAYFQYAGSESADSNYAVYPDAAAGWLVSNAAVHTLFNHMKHFVFMCEKLGEEIAMAQMILDMKLEVEGFINADFIANWPNDTLNVIGKDESQVDKDKIQKCPSKQFRFSQQLEVEFGRPAYYISTKMSGIPMDKVPDLLNEVSPDLKIGYPTDKPIFCWD